MGQDGVVTVEEAQGINTEIEYVEGMNLDRGYISPHFITDQDRLEAVIERPAILITDKKISAMADILPVLEKLATSGKRELVIIAEDVDGEALATLVVNKLRGIINSVARQGAGLRRPPQGDAARHRHPHRRPGDHRGDRHPPGQRHRSTISATPPAWWSARRRR